MKKLLVITLCIITLVFSACSGNNEKFEAKLSEQKEVSKVKLTELTDFKWDYAYFISPYVSKEEIEKIISIKLDEIQDNNNNDSTIYVVFTEKNKVVYQLFGDAQNLGFSFDLGKYKKFKRITCDNCDFSVQNKDGENIYKLIEK